MTVGELAEKLSLNIACGEGGLGRPLSGCYIGDLLSLAMSRVQKDNVWITIQTNINTAAVASLTEAGCILLCDGFMPDENTAKKADMEDIPILSAEKPAYELAVLLSGLGI
jgi:predicted transcriptional regulator